MSDADAPTGPGRRADPPAGGPGRAMEGFYGVLRWIARHVRTFHAALGVYLVLGIGSCLVALVAFAQVADEVVEGTTQRFDDAVLLWIDRHASDDLTVVALEVTALGSGAAVWMVVAVASLFLWISRHKYSVVLLWVAMVGAGLVNSALKLTFDRPRPQLFEWRQTYAGLSSFPSGHAATSMVVYATLAYLAFRLAEGRWLRRFTVLAAALVILLVGLSRLYLGVHYPSDVVAGYMVGFAWATICAMGIEVVRYFRHRRPQVARHEEDLREESAHNVREALSGDRPDEGGAPTGG